MTVTDIRLKILYAKITMCQEMIAELMENCSLQVSPQRAARVNKLSELIVSLEKQAQRLKRGSYAHSPRLRQKRN